MTRSETSLDDLIRAHRKGVGLSEWQRASNRAQLLSRASLGAAGLGAAGASASVGSHATLASRISMATSSWTVRIALSALLAGGASVGYVTTRPSAVLAVLPAKAAQQAAPSSTEAPRSDQASNPIAPPEPVGTSSSGAPHRAPATRITRAAAARALAAPSSLAAEVQLMHAVDAALRAGRPQLALSLLDSAHARGDGFMAEERAAAHIVTLCQLGRVQAARREAQHFLHDRPRSPLTARIRGTCAQPPDPASEKSH